MQQGRTEINRRLVLGIFGFFFAVYVLFISARLSSIDDKIMFDVTRSMLINGSFSSSEPLSNRDHFVEPWFYVVGQDGKAYSKYGLGQSLANLPFYALGKAVLPYVPYSYVDWFPVDIIPFKAPQRVSGAERKENMVVPAFTSLLNPAAIAVSCLLIFLLAYQFSGSLSSSLITAGLFGFATAAFPYAKLSFQHPLVICLVLAAFYYAFTWKERGGWWRLAVSGGCLGFAALTRYESILSFGVFLPYIWWAAYRRGKGTSSPLEGEGNSRIPNLLQQENARIGLLQRAVGLLKPTVQSDQDRTVGFSRRSPLLPLRERARMRATSARMGTQISSLLKAVLDASPFVLMVLAFELIVLWFNFVRFGSLFNTGYVEEGFTGELRDSIPALLFSPGRSILLFSPPALLGLFCLPFFVKRFPAEGLAFAALILGNFILYAKWSGWEGGWGWGPRYPLPLLPFLTLPILMALQAKAPWTKLLVLASVVVSLPVQFVGVATNFNDFYMERTIFQGVDFWRTVYDWSQSQIPGQAALLAKGDVDLWFYNLFRYDAPPVLKSLILIPLSLLFASGILIGSGLISLIRVTRRPAVVERRGVRATF